MTQMQVQLVRAMVLAVRDVVNEAMTMECSGCFVNHPSQIEHQCLMLGGEERLRFCLDRALLMLDWIKVKEEFWKQQTQDVFEWPSRFWDVEWFQHFWSDESWWEQLLNGLLSQLHPDDGIY